MTWEISTLKLQCHLVNVCDSVKKRRFLDSFPESSNYKIENAIGPWGVTGSACNASRHHHESYTTFGRHLELQGLTDQCKLGLSTSQAQQVVDLIDCPW